MSILDKSLYRIVCEKNLTNTPEWTRHFPKLYPDTFDVIESNNMASNCTRGNRPVSAPLNSGSTMNIQNRVSGYLRRLRTRLTSSSSTPALSTSADSTNNSNSSNNNDPNENYNNEIPRISLSLPNRLRFLLDKMPAGVSDQLANAWDPEQTSPNIYIKSTSTSNQQQPRSSTTNASSATNNEVNRSSSDSDNNSTNNEAALICHRHPVAQSSDGVRGKKSFENTGLHMWQIDWPTNERGTNAVIGVASSETPLQLQGYSNLVGCDEHSWGWDIVHWHALHNQQNVSMYPQIPASVETSGESNNTSQDQLMQSMRQAGFSVPSRIFMLLDCDQGTLSFILHGRFLGVAHRGLKGKKLYPMISAVWGHCEIRMRYLGSLYEGAVEPFSLFQLSRKFVRNELEQRQLRVKSASMPSKSTTNTNTETTNTDELLEQLELPDSLSELLKTI